jgi:putative transcriptional regulator
VVRRGAFSTLAPMSSLAPGLLLASPPLGDPNFERSVVLLANHSEEGAFGWVINGRELMSMGELLERARVCEAAPPDIDGVVRAGGPVGREQVWLLYPTDQRREGYPDQVDVGFGITATSSRRVLESIAYGDSPSPIVGLAGYASWGPSQLEEEIRVGAWLPTDLEAVSLFDEDPSGMWLRAFQRLGLSAMAFTARVVGSA